MRKRLIAMAVAIAAMLAGCGSNGDNPGVTAQPTASQSLEGSINIDGTLSISRNGEDYRIECKSNIPNGAFVTIFIMDENESVLSEISDLKQKQDVKEDEDLKKVEGKVVATIKAENLDKPIELNGSTQLFARLQFFPGDRSQPGTVQEVCGSGGELLTGNNVQKDDLAGQNYIEMVSESISIAVD